VVVDDVEDLDLAAVREPPVGDVQLPALVGLSAGSGSRRRRGLWCGCGVTNPRSLRIRQIVDTAGEWPWRCSRW
jgi:hypothetical protein